MALISSGKTSARAGRTLVDISDKPIEANIIREGKKVPPVDLKDDLLGDFVAPDRLDDRLAQPRVVYQSIKPGERVVRGTTVDVVLSSVFLIKSDLVAGSHTGLAEHPVGDVALMFLADEAVGRAVQSAATADDLSQETRKAIEETAAENDITIDETDSGRDFKALFKSIQAAQAFS